MTENLENEAQASSSDSMSGDSDYKPTSDIFVEGGSTDAQSKDDSQVSNNSESEKSEAKNIDADSSESSKTGASQDSSDSNSSPDGQNEEPEKIVMTKVELDAEEKKIREIAGRKAKREAQKEYEEQLKKLQSSQPQSQQAYGVQQGIPPQPSTSHIWVSELGQWVDSNQSIADFMNQAQGSQQQPQVEPNNYQQNQVSPQQSTQEQVHQFGETVYSQRDDCAVRISDFNNVMKQAALTENMVEAACVDQNGMKNLYKMAKDAPHELFQIAKLSSHEQQHRMWLMNEKFKQQQAEKLKTKATQQAAPLNNTGEVSKSENGLSLEELKKRRFEQYWSNS